MNTGAFVVGTFVIAVLMVAFSFAQDDRDGRVKLLLLSTVIGVICGCVTSTWINGEFHRLIESGLSIDGVKESLIGFAVVGVFLMSLLALSNEPRPGNISIGWSGVMVLLMFYLSSAAFIKKPSDDFKLQSSIVQSETVIYENNLNVTYTYVDDDGTINLNEPFDFKDLSTPGKMYAEKTVSLARLRTTMNLMLYSMELTRMRKFSNG